MSPPSKNHETMVPKRRPPSAHSSRFARFACPQRAATKPMSVTPNTNAIKTSAALDVVVPSREVEDHAQQRRRDKHPRELIPVKERQAEEAWLGAVIDPGQQRPYERQDQQKVCCSRTFHRNSLRREV